MLLDVQERGGYRVLGTTLDDAAGEAFDKGARLLGLGYPGGKEIDALARHGDPSAYDFPVARVPGLDFSFSGLKTALLYTVRKLSPAELEARRADLAASYQRAIVRALVERLQATGGRAPGGRRRCGGELGAPRRAAGGSAGSARALHRQRRDDRLGGALRRARPVPRVPFARCACRLERSHCVVVAAAVAAALIATISARGREPAPVGLGRQLAGARRRPARSRSEQSAFDRRAAHAVAR